MMFPAVLLFSHPTKAMKHALLAVVVMLLAPPPASAAEPPSGAEPIAPGRLVPTDWNPKLAADRVMAGLTNVSAPQVKSAHYSDFAIVGGRVFVVSITNDVQPGEAASWPFCYAAMSVVDLEGRRLEKFIYLGRQEATQIGGVHGSLFNIEVSADGVQWERKYRFETEKSFQYPTFREYQGSIYLTVTQGDDSKSRKERIMFGKLE